MAVITEYKKQESDFKLTAKSAAQTAATGTDVLMDGLGEAFRHHHITVRMFDVNGDQIVDAAAGTFTVTWQGPQNDTTLAATFEASSGAIDATAPETITIVGPVSAIKVVEAATTTVITWDVIVSAFES
jgi:hypothetical protein